MFCSSRNVLAFPANWSKNWLIRGLLFGVLLLGLPLLLAAQDATIVGTVTDASGGAIPNVAITLTNTETNLVVHSTTNDDGQYVVPNLRIGHYTVRAETPNFKTTEETGIVLQVGDRRRVD